MSNPAAIQTDALTHRYGRELALDSVAVTIPNGAICALVGANGAGKTTLIKILANLILPASGVATVLGHDSKTLGPAELQHIGYVSENQQLPGWMTVRYFLNYLRPFYPQWDRAMEERLIALLDVPLGKKLKSLSRGQRMKAAFIAALSYHPQLCILDEPFSGLDPLVREELIAALRDVNTDPTHPITFLISSHDLDEIETLATQLIYLDKGKVLFQETLSSLRERYRVVRLRIPLTEPTPAYPSHWLEPKLETGTLTFTHIAPEDNFGPDIIRAEVLQHLPQATDIESAPVSLRNLFLTVARERRSAGACL